MVDVRFSQLVRETSAQNEDTDVHVSQLVRITSVQVVPSFVRISQIVRITSAVVPPFDRIRMSQLVRITSVQVAPIADPCTIEPFALETTNPVLVRANWTRDVEMETSWQTDISQSRQDLAEDRRILQDRPLRQIKALVSELTRDPANRVANLVNRLAKNANPIPIWQDRRTLQANTATATLLIDTVYRRFYAGGRVGIAKPDGTQINGKDVLLLQILSVSPTSIVLTAAPPVTLEAGWDVYPMIDCDVVSQSKVDNSTDGVASTEITALEMSGCMTLPASSDEDVSAFFTYLSGYPILDVGPNWRDGVEVEVERTVDKFPSGRTQGISRMGTRAVQIVRVDYGVATRAQFWKILSLHDSRAGRGRGLWVIHPQTLWTHVGSGEDYVDIRATGYPDDAVEFYEYVAMIEPDGSLTIRPIVSVSLETSPTRHRLHLDDIDVNAPATISRIAPAILCRGDSDSLTEAWATEDICSSLKIGFRGLLREEDVPIG